MAKLTVKEKRQIIIDHIKTKKTCFVSGYSAIGKGFIEIERDNGQFVYMYNEYVTSNRGLGSDSVVRKYESDFIVEKMIELVNNSFKIKDLPGSTERGNFVRVDYVIDKENAQSNSDYALFKLNAPLSEYERLKTEQLALKRAAKNAGASSAQKQAKRL